VVFWHIRHWAKLLSDIEYREINRLLKLPRKQFGKTRLLGTDLSFVDGRTCALQYKVIFQDGIYAMESGITAPRILDVGANIGMATIYFKSIFPEARIDAFEADPVVASILQHNVDAFKLRDVRVHNVAASDTAGTLTFLSNGSDGGRLVKERDAVDLKSRSESTVQVPAVRLKDCLIESIDFLKLDIEGAEYDVIADCQDSLHFVRHIFVEYHSFVSRPQMLPEFLGFLRDAGFRLFVQTDYCASSPLKSSASDAGMDLRLNIFGTRALAS
jgi:FkbM family methyltransferase